MAKLAKNWGLSRPENGLSYAEMCKGAKEMDLEGEPMKSQIRKKKKRPNSLVRKTDICHLFHILN